MPRPGFVLDVDRSTPPTLFWRGEGFSLPVGQLSPVVETVFGYHVMRVDSRQPGEVKVRAVDRAGLTLEGVTSFGRRGWCMTNHKTSV